MGNIWTSFSILLLKKNKVYLKKKVERRRAGVITGRGDTTVSSGCRLHLSCSPSSPLLCRVVAGSRGGPQAGPHYVQLG